MTATASIALDLEVIVHIAFRVRGDDLSLSNRYVGDRTLPVRTPAELDAIVERFRETLWDGVRETMAALSAPAP